MSTLDEVYKQAGKVIVESKHKKRFLEKTIKTRGCWEWIGARSSFGHGTMNINGKGIGAHVISWMLKNKR